MSPAILIDLMTRVKEKTKKTDAGFFPKIIGHLKKKDMSPTQERSGSVNNELDR